MIDATLVLEGGGLRCTFTNGILDGFLEENLDFARVVGVSAGACAAASYVSRQIGRNWKVNVELASHPEFMGWRHLLRDGEFFNAKFTFEEIPRVLVPFDEDAFRRNSVQLDVVATSRTTGSARYFDKSDMERLGINRVLLASSSIPLLARGVALDGDHWYDGGVADSIPVHHGLSSGGKAVVVLTRPRGYRKKVSRGSPLLRLALRRHPAFLRSVEGRNALYNAQLDACDRLEQEGRILILAPSPEYPVGRTERRMERRAAAYRHGQNLAQSAMPRIRSFLEGEPCPS